jgi:hypothetical protein
MRTLLLLLAPLLLGACFGTNVLPEEISPYPNGKNRPIQGVTSYANIYEWQRSGYAQISDGIMDWPIFVAIATDGTACLVSSAVRTIAKSGDYVDCAPWRVRR